MKGNGFHGQGLKHKFNNGFYLLSLISVQMGGKGLQRIKCRYKNKKSK